MKRILLVALVLLWAAPAAASDDFPRPASLEKDVEFWIRIYTEVGTDGGLIHDSRQVAIVYDKLKFPHDVSYRERERRSEKRKREISKVLRSLGSGKRTDLGREERRILKLWPPGVSNSTLRAAASRVRFQLGQANKFKAGVIRSGEWIEHIETTLAEVGVPQEIASLPHVESSFTPHATSRVGASGLWQFTRSTGSRFMRVDHVIDERLDPFKATHSAARLLQQNRQSTGSWPLAITAYNHGAAGMRRAVSRLGTRDIATILRTYESRTFGFASRNFYLEFLAAVEVSENAERYFGSLHRAAPVEYETVSLPFYTTGSALAKALGVGEATLKKANLALLPTVWGGAKYIPKGYEVRVPTVELARPIETHLKDIPKQKRYAAQTRDLHYKIRRGDNLSTIARRNHTTVSELMALNGLRSRHRIRAGQKLRLPQDGASSPARVAEAPIDPPSDGLYSVRRGDSVARIASRFSVTEQQIVAMNALPNRNYIAVGQVIRVAPSKDRPPPTLVAVAAEAEVAPTIEIKPAPEFEAVAEVEAEAVPSAIEVAVVDEPAHTAFTPEEDAEVLRALAADPSDYSVAGDDSIEVQATETLGHYADWLGLRTQRLRQLNRLRYGKALAIHRRIKLDFSQVTREDFEHQRMEYHRSLQEEFFARYEISGTTVHVTRSGDSLWTLAQKKYSVPIWLIQQYNPDLDFASLSAGMRVTVPELRRRSAGSAQTDAG